MIYFDYNATTPLHPDVQKAMKKLPDLIGNPSSLHGPGRQAQEWVQEARTSVAEWVRAQSDQIVFTATATEANNWVLKTKIMSELSKNKNPHLIISAIEHPCIRETARYLEALGAEVSWCPVDHTGLVAVADIQALCRPNTALISVMAANNEVGTIQPISQIVTAATPLGIPVHTDAVQAVGKLPVSFEEWGVSFLTWSAHKVYGPKGAAALVMKDPLPPFIHGGAQERQLRAGTENVAAIVGMGKAAQLLAKESEQTQAEVANLTTRLYQELVRQIPDAMLNGHPTHKIANTLNMSFLGVNAESLMMNLDMEGIAVSTGSACSTGSIEPSETLLAMGLDKARYASAIRFSLGKWNTEKEVDIVVEKTAHWVKKMRVNLHF